MNTLTKGTKEKVEMYLIENEGASSVVWGVDSCTIFNVEGRAIEDFMIDIEEDDSIYCTPVSNTSTTIQVA